MSQPVQWILRKESPRPNPETPALYNRWTTHSTTETAEQVVAGYDACFCGGGMEIEGFIYDGHTHYYPEPIALS